MTITSILPATGSYGTRVTITGVDMGTDGAAWLDNSQIHIESRSDTRIVGTVGWGLSAATHTLYVFDSDADDTGRLVNCFTSNPDIGETVRTKIRKAVRQQIKNINTTNGFNNTIYYVYDPPREYTAMNQLPAVNLIWGREDRENVHKAANSSILDLSMELEIVGYFNERNDPYTRIDSFISDVQRRFGEEFYIPNETKEWTCTSCSYQWSEPFGIEANKPFFGVVVGLRILYHIRIDDSRVMA